jgi:hypothetical protein
MQEEIHRSSRVLDVARGLFGAALGGALGYLAFGWLLKQGFYALMLPGVLLGVGCGLALKRRSLPLAIVCGVAALALGLFAEWKHAPFVRDGTFAYFIAHLQDLRPFTLLLLALGAVGGFWFARRVREKRPPRQEQTQF